MHTIVQNQISPRTAVMSLSGLDTPRIGLKLHTYQREGLKYRGLYPVNRAKQVSIRKLNQTGGERTRLEPCEFPFAGQENRCKHVYIIPAP